jgi:hypothetical protein
MFHVAVAVDRWAKSGMDGENTQRRDGGTDMHGAMGSRRKERGREEDEGGQLYINTKKPLSRLAFSANSLLYLPFPTPPQLAVNTSLTSKFVVRLLYNAVCWPHVNRVP